ncbi:MAG: transglycosylase domain-containing protein [Spirochaetota bacterium]
MSKFPEKPGLYKITCVHCKEVTHLKVSAPKKEDPIPVPPVAIKESPQKAELAKEEKKPTIAEELEAKIEDKRRQKKGEGEGVEQKDAARELPQEETPASMPPPPVEKFPEDTAKHRAVQEELWRQNDTIQPETKDTNFPVEKPPVDKADLAETETDFTTNKFLSTRDYLWEKHIPLFLRSRTAFISAILAFLLLLVFSIVFVIGYSNATEELGSLLSELSKNKPSIVYDKNGKVLSEIYQKKTGTTKLSEYPPQLIQMLLAVEDRDFYHHGGIDYVAIVRAFFKNVATLEYSQGASTITMQLARILIKDRRKSLLRKFHEAFVALAIESKLQKKQILEAYMNQVYLGHGAFGFENAAKYYFQKELKKLDTKEMILLASLPSAPNRYSPFKNTKLSKKRFRILTAMLINNKVIRPGYMAQIQGFYMELKKPQHKTVFGSRLDEAPYVTEHIRAILLSINPDKDIYYEGGFRIETTVDVEIQKAVIKSIASYMEKRRNDKKIRKKWLLKKEQKPEAEPVLQAAVVGIDPQTGEMLFMHGGGDKFSSTNQFNRAIQMKRQTGSSIKPVVYAAAIDTGTYNTGMKVLDAQTFYKGKNGGQDWAPSNYGNDYDGEIFLRTALVKSKNTVAVQIVEKLGLPAVKDYFSKFFFPDKEELKNRYRSDLSVALGSVEISPLEMATAYSAFANDGMIKRPYLIKKIVSASGKVIYTSEDKDEFHLHIPPERRVIAADTSQVMVSLMRSSGVASQVRSLGYKGVVAGKTGTTNDYKDAWFVGTRPNLAMAVWVGYDNSSFGMGPMGVGSGLAAPLWGAVAKEVDELDILEKRKFAFSKKAKWLTICADTGSLASYCNCTEVKREIFTQAHPPTKECKSEPEIPLEEEDVIHSSTMF